MGDWTINDLKVWDERISVIAKDFNLDWFPILYETCDYYEMIGNMSYHGMPSHYPHWSFGKSFERTHQMYNAGLEGLPYELIINSDPSIAYLMRENPLYMQILIMAHCVGHSDFFKNNRMFKDTRPETVIARFRNGRKRIQSYIEDPSIGIEKVEKIIDSIHTIQHHTYKFPKEYISHKEKKAQFVHEFKNSKDNSTWKNINLDKVPIEPEHDLLGFILEHKLNFEEWERDIVEIIREEGRYFIPQIQTKIMNEGWACFWHYRIIHELNLPQKYHLPFIKSHNQVVRPFSGQINPYHLGFCLFNKIEKRHGIEECFFAREIGNDESFIRQYLTQEDCEELNLFSYALKKTDYIIEEISDDDGWKAIKKDLIAQIGTNSMPVIYVESIDEDNILVLHHEHDGRDLEIEYAENVIENLNNLWDGPIKLLTIIEDEPFEI